MEDVVVVKLKIVPSRFLHFTKFQKKAFVFVRIGSNMRMKAGVSEENLRRVTKTALEKVILHVELLTGPNNASSVGTEDARNETAAASALERLLASARTLATRHLKRETQAAEAQQSAFITETSDWSDWKTQETVKPGGTSSRN